MVLNFYYTCVGSSYIGIIETTEEYNSKHTLKLEWDAQHFVLTSFVINERYYYGKHWVYTFKCSSLSIQTA